MITLVFADALQPFLPPARRGGAWCLAAAPGASLKHVIEACGVPHTEVGAIRVNGQPAGFAERVADGDHIEVRGWSAADLQASHGLRRWPPAQAMRFVADAHLGGLARRLRMAIASLKRQNWLSKRSIKQAGSMAVKSNWSLMTTI